MSLTMTCSKLNNSLYVKQYYLRCLKFFSVDFIHTATDLKQNQIIFKLTYSAAFVPPIHTQAELVRETDNLKNPF